MKPSNLPEIGQGITWTGAVGSFVGAIKSIDLLTVVGALVAVGGFLMNWHYSR
ncbi:holin, partial [Neisseria bacilliformis]